MTEQIQEEVFGLMSLAKRQQEAVQIALDGLAAERAKLAADISQQAEAVDNAARSVVRSAATIRQAAQDIIPVIQKATGDTVGVLVRESLAGASNGAAMALGAAAKPILERLSSIVQAASEAEGSIRKAGAWFAWKWVAVAALGIAALCLVAYGGLAWQVGDLREKKASLQADIDKMQANVTALEKRGGHTFITDCGGRLCIEAGKEPDWTKKDTGARLVIPRGY
jgi:Arc/MetJ family transcription regulator